MQNVRSTFNRINLQHKVFEDIKLLQTGLQTDLKTMIANQDLLIQRQLLENQRLNTKVGHLTIIGYALTFITLSTIAFNHYDHEHTDKGLKTLIDSHAKFINKK